MPELPEVEVFRRFVEQHAMRKTIAACQIFNPRILEKGMSAQDLLGAAIGREFVETYRRGKYLFIRLSGKAGKPEPWLLLHFGMTGYLGWFTAETSIINAYGDPKRPNAHIRAQFDFADGGHLAFHEPRMFGKMDLVDDPEAYCQARKLGPDALSVDEKTFVTALAARKGQIKPALMDQSLVAGVGNVYADEMLFQCKIQPERRISDLSAKDHRCLYAQMVEILQKTVDCGADRHQLPKGYLLHARSSKGRCPRDKTLLAVRTVGGRTTYFCPACQKEG